MKTIEVEIKKFKEDNNSSVSTGADSEKKEKKIDFSIFFRIQRIRKNFCRNCPLSFFMVDASNTTKMEERRIPFLCPIDQRRMQPVLARRVVESGSKYSIGAPTRFRKLRITFYKRNVADV